MNKITFALFIALRSLFSRRSRYAHSAIGWIAIVGLILGVASQLVSVSILAGFEEHFTKAILGFNAHLVLMRDGEISDAAAVLQHLSKWKTPEGITFITPFLYREGLMAHHSKVKGVVLKGIDPLTFGEVYDVKIRLFSNPSGSLTLSDALRPKGAHPPLLLGEDLAQELGVKKEDSLVSVFSPQGELKNIADIKNFTRFEVIGTFSSGLYEYDAQFALLDLSYAQNFFKSEGRISGFEMRVNPLSQAASLARQMEQQFAPPFRVIAWDELNEEIFSALRLEKRLFFVIMGLIVIVAAANLVGLMVILITNQSKEISILKAMGTPSRTLKAIFAFQGMILALLGVALGCGVGWLLSDYLVRHSVMTLAKEVYLVSTLPLALSWKNFLYVVLFATGISYFATYFATRHVVKMQLDL